MAGGKTLKESDYTQTDDPSRFLDLKDGDIFDLGGVHLIYFRVRAHAGFSDGFGKGGTHAYCGGCMQQLYIFGGGGISAGGFI